jgi:hypothetical protein
VPSISTNPCDALAAVLRRHGQRADLAQIRPEHVQRAAADHPVLQGGDPEVLDVLVQRHDVLGQQLAVVGVGVDQALDGGHVGGAGTPDD